MTELDLTGAGEPRTPQICHGCGVTDDHPRHHVIYSLEDDSRNKTMHFDCCVADGGCPNHCEPVLAASGGAKGAELLAHILANPKGGDRNEGAPAESDGPANRKG